MTSACAVSLCEDEPLTILILLGYGEWEWWWQNICEGVDGFWVLRRRRAGGWNELEMWIGEQIVVGSSKIENCWSKLTKTLQLRRGLKGWEGKCWSEMKSPSIHRVRVDEGRSGLDGWRMMGFSSLCSVNVILSCYELLLHMYVCICTNTNNNQ